MKNVKSIFFICAVCLIVAITFLINRQMMNKNIVDVQIPDGGNLNNINKIFFINKSLHYITENGELYEFVQGNVYKENVLKTYNMLWSDKFQKFYYTEGFSLLSCDITGWNSNELWKTSDDAKVDLVSITDDYAIVDCKFKNRSTFYSKQKLYCINLNTFEENILSEMSLNDNNDNFVSVLTSKENMIFYVSSDYQKIGAINCINSKNMILAEEKSDVPIVTASVIDGYLYYSRHKSSLCRVPIKENSKIEIVKMNSENLSNINIAAISKIDNCRVLVVVVDGYKKTMAYVLDLKSFKMTVVKNQSEGLIYIIPGSCKVVVDGNLFYYTVTTEQDIAYGNFLPIKIDEQEI